ncbi:MAG: phosphate ABC transporter substrate-binding/OmpA family protein [Chitinophagales bacterium]
MASQLTGFSKLLITLIIVGIIGGGLYYLANMTDFTQNGGIGEKGTIKNNDSQNSLNSKASANKNSSSSSDDVLKVQVFTWGGYAGGEYFNKGFKHNPQSRFTKDYGLDVDFVLLDDFDASRQAWIADEVHLIGTTVDALPTEMERLQAHNPQVVFQVDWSRGGDAIVGKRGINSINDLKGKSVAVTPSTPSQTFLLWMLEAANLELKDVKVIEVPSAIDAATAFKSGKVDAAVVWSPDDEICVREVPGAKVLQSTREASHIIADVFIAKKKFVDANADKIAKLYEGFMIGAAEINSSEAKKREAAKYMAKGTGISEQDALGAISTVRLCTHGDNLDFFGRNPKYKGVTAEKLYSKMGDEYVKLKFAKANYPNWRTIAYPGAISAAKLNGGIHLAEGQKDFKPAKAAAKTAPALSSKPISISFATGKYVLGENAKTLIDVQFSDIAKAFGNARIRVEGNTDNVGSRISNIKLSEKRAQSVAQYLQQQYGMDKDRFIVLGNGPDKPIAGCEKNQNDACKSKNRRTEFLLIAE